MASLLHLATRRNGTYERSQCRNQNPPSLKIMPQHLLVGENIEGSLKGMALYKRGKTWWMSFIFNGDRIQITTKCTNIRDAETVERAYRTQLAKGEVGVKAKKQAPTFKGAMKEFQSWVKVEHRSKPNTVRSYEVCSRPLIEFFREKRIDKIDSSLIEKYKEHRSKQRPTPKKAKKKGNKNPPRFLKPATINRELALLKIFFNYQIRKDRDIISLNPVSEVKFFAEDNIQTRVVSFEEEEAYLLEASQPLMDVASLIVDTGMRPGEVALIRRTDVFLDQGYISIPRGKTKAAKRRIPLTDRAYEILERRMEDVESEYLFNSEITDQPITTLKTAHMAAIRRSEVAYFRLYDLRHTFATRFVEAGGDLVTLQALMGHSDIKMVTRYAHPTQQHQFDAIKKMQARKPRPKYDKDS